MPAACKQTVLEWLVLVGWQVDVSERDGRFAGSASRRIGADTIRVTAESDSVDLLAWRLVEAATLELERHGAADRRAVVAA
jgi:hypothetical protein